MNAIDMNIILSNINQNTDTFKRVKKWSDENIFPSGFSEPELVAQIIDSNKDSDIIKGIYIKSGNLMELNLENYISKFGDSSFTFASSTKIFKEIMNYYGYKVSIKKTVISKTPSEWRGGKRTSPQEYGDIIIKYSKI